METGKAFTIWGGSERDLLTLLLDRLPEAYGADPDEDDFRLVLYRVLDTHEEATGDVVGVEILDFLSFDRWYAVPDVPHLWQLPDTEPMPLKELLQCLQATLRARAKIAAHA